MQRGDWLLRLLQISGKSSENGRRDEQITVKTRTDNGGELVGSVQRREDWIFEWSSILLCEEINDLKFDS